MGYAYYVLPDGREAGYGVNATCDHEGCSAEIDRGIAYLCGRNPGGDEFGCGDYFCDEHLFMGEPCQLCEPCLDRWIAESKEAADEA